MLPRPHRRHVACLMNFELEIAGSCRSTSKPKSAENSIASNPYVIDASADQIDRLERAIVMVGQTRRGHTPVDHDFWCRCDYDYGGDHKGPCARSRRVQVGSPRCSLLGLTPRSHSGGGKERLGRISKMGNPELRALLVVGATTVLRVAETTLGRGCS